ncbi:MAG: sulfatase-like hydrolase/transferase [Alphaproteobacteria bacterium]|nr:sulfatase-like hydrolase/transferase [Alphaproteobacteria bacterium]
MLPRLLPLTVLIATLLACSGKEPAAGKRAAKAPPPATATAESEDDAVGDDTDAGDDDEGGSKARGGHRKGPGVVAWTNPEAHATVALDALPEGEPAFVALVVMDTVRADHTQLCGYERPNTPNLVRFAKLARAVSCDTYSPATWTLPAHASYLTGRPTAEHGVHTLGTPLDDRFETLAETYAARGYQTLLLSANPVFGNAEGGFWQGFDRVVVAEGLRGPLREEFGRMLKAELERLDPDKPLFAFINLIDAHDPYPDIPEGLDWVEPAERLSLNPHTADPKSPYYQFVTGQMPEPKQGPYLARIKDAYDHAVYTSDANLGVLIRGLTATGWIARPHRMVITSDHGEHLGEHQLLRHGSAVWQTVTRIPFLYFDNMDKSPMTLPSPMSGTTAWTLLHDGKLPEPALLVESASAENPDDFKPSWESVAVWQSNEDKLMYLDGKRMRFDLSADPMEEHPLAFPVTHPGIDTFAERLAAHEKSLQDALERGPDPEVMKLMQAVGYVQ